jgi:hypothetical protein
VIIDRHDEPPQSTRIVTNAAPVSGSTNLQLVSDVSTRASLISMMGSVITQVVATGDTDVITTYFINQRNLLSMAMINAKAVTVPYASRRLLAVSQPTRDSIDAIYAQVYSTLDAMSTSLITAEGEAHAFEQSGLSVEITRKRLALTSSTYIFNSNLTLESNTDAGLVSVTVMASVQTWPTSSTFQSNNAIGTEWLVDVSMIAAYPNPYGVVDATYNITDFITAGVSIGGLLAPTSTQSDTAPFTTTLSNYVELPIVDTSRVYTGSGYRPICVQWNNITWVSTSVTTTISPTSTGYYRCSFTMSSTYVGPISLIAKAITPPVMVTAQLVATSVSVLITFDQITDQSGSSLGCATYFDAGTMTSLGGTPQCTWGVNTAGTASTLTVTGFQGVLAGVTLQLNNGVFRSSDGYSTLNTAHTVITERQSSYVLVSPTILIDGRASYSSCETISLSAIRSYGGEGVALFYQWNIEDYPQTTTYETISGWNTSYATMTPTLGLLPTDGTFRARLSLYNWLGGHTELSYAFNRTSLPIPVITVTPGTTIVLAREDPLNLTATAAVSPCSATTGVTIASHIWSLISSSVSSFALTTVSITSDTLYYYPYTLVPGTYILAYTAIDSNGNTGLNTITVTVTNTTAPSRVSAQFNDACTRVDVTYDSNTDRAGNDNCGLILPTSTIALLGDGYQCVWSTAYTFSVVLGTNYNIRNAINITSGVVGSEDGCSGKESNSDTLSISAPSTEPTVTAVITGQSIVGSCRGIELSGTQSTGQAGVPASYSYKWSTTSPTPSSLMSYITGKIEAAELIANSSGTPWRTLILDATSIPSNYSYGFVLTTTNWRGVSAVSDTFTITKLDDLVLETSIAATDGRQVTRKDTVLTVVNYDADSICGYGVASTTYEWSQTEGPEIPSILGDSTKTLIITPYQMTASYGTAGYYEFEATVTVTLVDGRVLTDTSTTNWQVIPLALQPLVGGSNRLVSLYYDAANITLDASLSYDPDILGNVGRDSLTYLWNCTIRSTGVPCTFIPPYPDFNQSTLVVLKSQLGTDAASTLLTSDALVFTVTVGTSLDVRTSTSSVQIETTLEYAPSVAVRSVVTSSAPISLSDGTTAIRVAISDPLTLRAYVTPITSTTTLLWSCTSGNLDLDDENVRLTPLTSANLVIAANVFLPGAVYTFELTAIDTTYSNVTGRSSTRIVTNAAPVSGSCTPSSSSIPYNESVQISCYDWTDDSIDLPLTYTYGFITDEGLQTVIGFAQTSSSIRTMLPMGATTNNFVRSVYVEIADKYKAVTRVYINVTVTPPSLSEILADPTGSLTTATSVFTTSISDAVDSADSNLLVSSVAAASSMLTYYATATANASATYSPNGIYADVYLSYLTANKSMELRLSIFNDILSFADNDQRPASTGTVTQSLSVINTLLGAPAELGISTSLTANDTVAQSEVRLTLREAAGSLLYDLAYLAFSNPNVTFTSEIGDILVSGLDAISSSSLADSSPSGTEYTNGTTALQREQARNAARLTSTVQLVTLGETSNMVVGQDAIEHVTTRMYVSSQRQSLTDTAGLTIGGSSSSSSLNGLYSYNITQYNSTNCLNETIIVESISPSFSLPNNIFTSTPGPIIGYNYTLGDDGNITSIPIYGEWPVQVDISQLNYKNNLYQWRESTINDTSNDASLSSLQGLTLYPHSDPYDEGIDDLDVDTTNDEIVSEVPISGLNDTSSSSSSSSSSSGGILISIPLVNSSITYIAECRFWNESLLDGAGNWSTDGCSVYSRNDTYLVCSCTHLTVFNAFMPTINIPSIPSLDDLLGHPEGWITMICIWVVFAALVPLIMRHDKERFPIALASHVDQHSQLVKTGSIEIENDAQYQPGMTRTEMKKLYLDKLLDNMRQEHSWFAAFYRHPLTGYSSCEQLTMCFLIVLGSMAVAGFFFGVDDGGDIIERIKAAVFTSLLMVPLGTIVNYLLSGDPAKSATFAFVQERVAAAELAALGIKYQPGTEAKVWNAYLKEKEKAWKVEQKLAAVAAKSGDDMEKGTTDITTAPVATYIVATPSGATSTLLLTSPSAATATTGVVSPSAVSQSGMDVPLNRRGGIPSSSSADGDDIVILPPPSRASRSPPKNPQFTFVELTKIHQQADVTSVADTAASSSSSTSSVSTSSVPPAKAPLPPPPVPPQAPAPLASMTTAPSTADPIATVTPTPATGASASTADVSSLTSSKKGKKHKKSTKVKKPKVSKKSKKGSATTATNTVIDQSSGGVEFDPAQIIEEEPQPLPRRRFPLCCLREKPFEPQFEYRYTTELKLHEVRQDWDETSYWKRAPPRRIFGIIWTLLMMAASSFLIIVRPFPTIAIDCHRWSLTV